MTFFMDRGTLGRPQMPANATPVLRTLFPEVGEGSLCLSRRSDGLNEIHLVIEHANICMPLSGEHFRVF